MSDGKPQAALAAVDWARLRWLVGGLTRQPTLLIGCALLLTLGIVGFWRRLEVAEPDAWSIFAGAALLSFTAGAGRRPTLNDREGPLGFTLVRCRSCAVLTARRTLLVLAIAFVSVAVLVVAVRPEMAAQWLSLGLVGSVVGATLGIVIAGSLTPVVPIRIPGARLRMSGRLCGAVLAIGLLIASARVNVQGSIAAAQAFAALAIVCAVAPMLPVDARRLQVLAATPIPLSRLILNWTFPPAISALVFALGAGLATGLSGSHAIAMAAGLASIASLARIFLILAALGRSEVAARSAGLVELVVALLLPLAGPAALGPITAVWILGRLAWLWRRGARVRWLDVEAAR